MLWHLRWRVEGEWTLHCGHLIPCCMERKPPNLRATTLSSARRPECTRATRCPCKTSNSRPGRESRGPTLALTKRLRTWSQPHDDRPSKSHLRRRKTIHENGWGGPQGTPKETSEACQNRRLTSQPHLAITQPITKDRRDLTVSQNTSASVSAHVTVTVSASLLVSVSVSALTLVAGVRVADTVRVSDVSVGVEVSVGVSVFVSP